MIPGVEPFNKRCNLLLLSHLESAMKRFAGSPRRFLLAQG
jgi:hypothetical protein